MAIINPETLEKLVQLKAKYPGSIDLFTLKKYLIAGHADQELEKYIVAIEQQMKIRSHIIKLVKNHLENSPDKNVGVDMLYGAYIYSNPPQSLDKEQIREILIELSSPLTGYLGRIKEENPSDERFYFLRELT